MEELYNQLKYLIGGYYGVALIDEYPLKEYILNDVNCYIRGFVVSNNIDEKTFNEMFASIKDEVSEKVKLQDALLVMNKVKGPMDLVFLIKEKLKKYSRK